MYRLRELEGQRYVGDTETMTVHDRWHQDCEDCLMEEIIARGTAVAFEPDDLDQAFMEQFDYCPACIDRSEPKQPEWAKARREVRATA